MNLRSPVILNRPFSTSAPLAIVGAGPIGLELAAALKRAEVDYNIRFLPRTLPVEIRPGSVVLERLEHPADFVLLNTGFLADMSLFEQAGVNLVGEDRALARAVGNDSGPPIRSAC
jgi:NADPH-dependent 2,4-dienoyl-CoA reductase/sulfur reductase-like enzyme